VNEETVRSYERAADAYALQTPANIDESLLAFIEAFLALLGPAPRILEVGSGPGRDADLLEQRGATVVRTDAAWSFVRRLRAAGHEATLLNVLSDDFGGPYDGVFADAVFLHVPRQDLPGVLDKAHRAVRAEGGLAFTVKTGEGEQWSLEKLGLPRFFSYWTADAIRDLIRKSAWQLVDVREVAGRTAEWLHVLCRRA
jgi:SAM-dependent methyltransferase